MFQIDDKKEFLEFIRAMYERGDITKNSHSGYRSYINKIDQGIPADLSSLGIHSFSELGILELAKSLPTRFRQKYGLTMLRHYGNYRTKKAKSQSEQKHELKVLNYWLFQAVPEQYELRKELIEGRVDDWKVNRSWNIMKKGDRLILWQSGEQAGIYGEGELASNPYKEQGKFRVDVLYHNQFVPPILKDRLVKHPILKNLSVLKNPFQGTNFKVTLEQWNALGIMDALYVFQADEIESPIRYFEGAIRSICVNSYERNFQARKMCLEYHGYDCRVCGLNFEQIYGPRGKDFIHVHHLKPLSEIKETYVVNPIEDLCPVCPNCHAMIHKGNPMMSICELRALVSKQPIK